MWPNPQETADLVTFTEEILNGKRHLLYIVNIFFTYFLINIGGVIAITWNDIVFRSN